MDGLRNNKNNNGKARALMQWHQLFSKGSTSRSSQACAHWKNVEYLGLPTCKHEDWKHTSLEGLLSHSFDSVSTRTVTAVERDTLSLMLDAYRLVFINGCLSPELSDHNIGLWKIKVEEGANRKPLPNPIQSEIFLHLTECLSAQTTHIYLAKGETSLKPLYLLHISHGAEAQKTLSMVHYRHHIEIDWRAQGQVIEHFVSTSSKKHFSGTRTSINVGDSACFRHIKLAFENSTSYHFSHNDIRIGTNAIVHSSAFMLGAEFTRHQTSAQLNGEGTELFINSLALPSEHEVSDTRSYLEHNKGHCLSRQLHKIIARDSGKGIFHGLIKVAKHALKTDGKMTNNNLLLDTLTEVSTTPKLEIYADDVKCSHGATVGYIDEGQMLYLRSRGINSEKARRMLVYAFAEDVTKEINHDVLRDIVLTRITHSLSESKDQKEKNT